MNKKLADPELFRRVKEYITVYAPVVRRKSGNTVKAYKDSLNLYFDFLLELKPLHDVSRNDFNSEMILAFLEWLSEVRHNESTTVNQRLSHIRSFCSYIMKNDILNFAELDRIGDIARLVDTRKTEFTFLSIDDMRSVLSQPSANTKTGLRDLFYMSLLYDSGCRNQELLDLKVKDFDIRNPKSPQLHVIGKGSKYRVTPISASLVRLFRKYTKVYDVENTPESYLFFVKRKDEINPMSDDNVQRFLLKYENQIKTVSPNFPHLHAHLFRRSRAMHLYMAGVPLPLIAQWLGHSNLETVQVYAKATVDMKRKALDKALQSDSSVFQDDAAFKYASDAAALKKLCGLK